MSIGTDRDRMVAAEPGLLRRAVGFLRRVVRNRWKLRPRVRTHVFLGRAVEAGGSAGAPEGVRLVWVDRADSPHFEDLIDISAHQGMDRSWCMAELGRDNAMLLAFARTEAGRERVAGVGWLNGGAHYIDDTFHHFDAGAAGCQLFNCIVLPQFRGRRLQRVLTRGRLVRAAERGKKWVYTTIEASNAPSMRNSVAEGNRPVVRVRIIEWMGRRLALVRRLTHRIPMGRLTFAGWPRWSGWVHVVRPQG